MPKTRVKEKPQFWSFSFLKFEFVSDFEIHISKFSSSPFLVPKTAL